MTYETLKPIAEAIIRDYEKGRPLVSARLAHQLAVAYLSLARAHVGKDGQKAAG